MIIKQHLFEPIKSPRRKRALILFGSYAVFGLACFLFDYRDKGKNFYYGCGYPVGWLIFYLVPGGIIYGLGAFVFVQLMTKKELNFFALFYGLLWCTIPFIYNYSGDFLYSRKMHESDNKILIETEWGNKDPRIQIALKEKGIYTLRVGNGLAHHWYEGTYKMENGHIYLKGDTTIIGDTMIILHDSAKGEKQLKYRDLGSNLWDSIRVTESSKSEQ